MESYVEITKLFKVFFSWNPYPKTNGVRFSFFQGLKRRSSFCVSKTWYVVRHWALWTLHFLPLGNFFLLLKKQSTIHKDVFKTCIGKVRCMEWQKLAFFVHCFVSECLANQPTTVSSPFMVFTRGNFFGNLLHPFELK